MIAHYVDAEGRYVGAATTPPPGATAVPAPPADARDVWEFPGWRPAPPPPAKWSKALLFAAMTDAEHAQFETAAAAFSARERAVFDGAAVLEESSPLWPQLAAALHANYGPARVAALLAAAAI